MYEIFKLGNKKFFSREDISLKAYTSFKYFLSFCTNGMH